MIALVFIAAVLITSNQACLHSGCSLDGGLQSNQVNVKNKELIRGTEKAENVIKVVTWNLEGRDKNWNGKKESVCRQLERLQPTIFGLQGVSKDQVKDIDICLQRKYQIFKSHVNNPNDAVLNPIFIKRFGIKIKILKHGVFSLSKSPRNLYSKIRNAKQIRHCTWVKISYGIEENYERKRENFKSKLQRLLGIFTGQEDPNASREMSTIQRKKYKYKTVFIANTQLDNTDVDVATEQVKAFMWFLKSRVMDRRRYPVIVTGDFGFETNTKVHEAIRKYRWLENTMEFPRQRYPDVSFRDDSGDALRDFVFENKFKQILSAVVVDSSEKGEHRAVVSTLIK